MWYFLNNASTIEIIAVCFFIAATVSSVCVYLNKNVIGKVVRRLVAENADTAESAKTLAEIGLAGNFLVKAALRGKGGLRKLVNEIDDKIIMLPDGSSYFEREGKLDFSSARFYIREENRVRAELRYSAKGTDLFMLLIGIIVYFGIAWMIVWLVPLAFDLFRKAVS